MGKSKLHSIVDVITNSSTEIFTWIRSDAISQAKKNVQAYMDLMGVEGSVDELFDFKIAVSYETESQPPICPSCQNVLAVGWMACPKCGHNLLAPAVATPSHLEKTVLTTDAQVSELEKKLGTAWHGCGPKYDGFEVFVTSKKTGKKIDLVRMPEVVYEEAYQNG